MDLVIVGSMGYDDIETPVATGSDILGGSAVHAGVSASFHLPKTPEGICRVGMVAPVGMDFSDSHQRKLEELGIDFSGVAKYQGRHFDGQEDTRVQWTMLRQFPPSKCSRRLFSRNSRTMEIS